MLALIAPASRINVPTRRLMGNYVSRSPGCRACMLFHRPRFAYLRSEPLLVDKAETRLTTEGQA